MYILEKIANLLQLNRRFAQSNTCHVIIQANNNKLAAEYTFFPQ